MASISNPKMSPGAAARAGSEVGPIDASTRSPLLLFAGSAALWLLIGSALQLIASIKLHAPGFLTDCAWLTYGRIHGAENTVLLYGWGCNVAFAIILWLLARLSDAVVRQPGVLSIAGAFWNVGVTVAAVGILAGDGTSLEGLEMPAYAAPILFLSYLFIGTWAFLTYRTGRSEHVYISQWFVLGALFWFPWLFSVTQLMLFVDPVRGTLQALVHAWYTKGLFYLWFLPVGLGAAYYFIPKALQRPVSNYYLSVYGFWTLAFLGSWVGFSHLIGAPVPAWTVSAGIAAAVMLLLPLSIFAINFVPTLFSGGSSMRERGYGLLVIGVLSALVYLLAASVLSLRGVAALTQFSFISVAHSQLGFYGCFSLIAFGAIYAILPRVTGLSWPNPGLVGLHVACGVAGLLLIVVSLTIGGYGQATALNSVTGADSAPISMVAIAQNLKPYLVARTVGVLVILLGHVAFAANVFLLSCRAACACSGARSGSVSFRPGMEATAR